MLDGGQWRESIHDFYTFDGALALREKLRDFTGGRVVVHVVEMPIKCPVAPLEFAFLADAFFRGRGMRDRVELVYVTPLPGAFTKPIASARLGGMLDERKIALEPDFVVERIDADRKTLVSYDEREVPFDLLVTVPLNMGADYIARSGLGDELNYVPVDKHTLLSTRYDNIFAVGDASNIPASKAGSVAHFSVEVFVENFLAHIDGRPMTGSFDGHANCYVEAGDGKALLIDFNYDTEPLPGTYPVPHIGPFRLLEETRINHWGKLAFRWMYWHLLLPGRPHPAAGPHVHGRQEDPVDRAREAGGVTCLSPRSPDTRSTWTRKASSPTYDEWDEDLAGALATQIGLELTEEHLDVIRFLRQDFQEQGETATLRRVSTVGGVPTKRLFELFPKKPAKKMAYVAGLPKPHGCV